MAKIGDKKNQKDESILSCDKKSENTEKNGAIFDLKKELQDCASIFSIKIKKLYRKIRQQNRRIYYLEQENKRLRQLAFLDDLTQLANRRKFYLYLKQHWRGSLNRPTSLILGDVDFFKAYNDNYGHLAGDLCLQQIAEAIQDALKGQNEAQEYLAARYGGEEFAIVLPDTELKDAIAIAEKIRLNIVAKKIPHVGSEIRPWITLSAGVSTQKLGQEFSPETLILAADRALYQAKNNGRDRVCSDT
ncbi:diguanylate cyclase domain-containing protein [Lyngbya sp. CCY1209]|uniref:GGDEF domain-containing protein n=1 Tax=Lyngbya sp. CCY1209 TaxID=2886103 RepID=UPI002D208EBA|nr:diguanylate cyclase [Lyngbya sp. CCY1209]MEB3882386.1 diguanylate cyclase [Lyngbya sp. CCY1209]